MATTSEARALPFFTDLLGQPLASGFIYIGQPGLDPIAYPAVIHSDIAGTTVVAQPVRTTNGHAASSGALIHLYCPIPYSITILDSAGRVVYTSLNETDPVAQAIGSSSVQSAPDLATLRARSGSSTNQVWVDGFGMYVYVPTDTTSPESIPSVIVGNDGSRYHQSIQYVSAVAVRVSGDTPTNNFGAWLHWNTTTGISFLTNNLGGGGGGTIIRTVSADNSTELGRVTVTSTGDLISSGSLTATGTVTASGNITTAGGVVNLNAGGTRSISFSATNYNLPGANLLINGSLAVNDTRLPSVLASNQQGFGVGSIIITNGAAPVQPGTWTLQVSGLGASGLAQYVRTA